MALEHEPREWLAGSSEERGRANARPEPKARPAAAAARSGVQAASASSPVEPGLPVPPEWCGTEAEYPSHATLHGLVGAQARRSPHAPALLFGAETVTYAQMDARADAVARRLRALGVGPERRVGLCVERGPAQIIGVLGILKAGGAYLPIDPAAPPERRAFVLADAGATALVADAAGLAGLEPSIPVLRADLESHDDGGGEPVECGTGPDSLAYVLYTSGSTGRPKGVLGIHRGMVNLVHWQARTFGAGPGERILAWAPLSFDAGSAETFTALVSGAALVLGTREQMIPGRELLAVLRSHRVTNAKFTPSALAALPFAELPDLRVVLTGGEALDAELVERWGPGRRFFNVYGPTETSVRGAATEVHPGGGRPSIGRPLPNARMHVLDERGDPIPVGAEGELCIGGVGLARGYLGRPGLTAGVFVPDPFSGRPGARLYRTGDRGGWRPDGELEFLGRRDDQVKVRGFRVEPGEVAAALREVPGVHEGAVVARADDGEVRLVAYWAGSEALTAAELRRTLEKRLLDHMVPSAFVRLPRLPLTAHGKLDRRALPAPQDVADDAPSLDAVLRAASASTATASGDGDAFAPLHLLVSRRASSSPDGVVSVDGAMAALGTLDARAGRLANRLLRLTDGRGERIAVALAPSPEMAVAVLAALKTGGACVAVDPREGDAGRSIDGAAVVVTTSCVAARLHLPSAVLSLDGDAELVARERPASPEVEVDAGAAALVVSGVAISHAVLAAAVRLPRETLRGVPVLALLAGLVAEPEREGR